MYEFSLNHCPLCGRTVKDEVIVEEDIGVFYVTVNILCQCGIKKTIRRQIAGNSMNIHTLTDIFRAAYKQWNMRNGHIEEEEEEDSD